MEILLIHNREVVGNFLSVASTKTNVVKFSLNTNKQLTNFAGVDFDIFSPKKLQVLLWFNGSQSNMPTFDFSEAVEFIVNINQPVNLIPVDVVAFEHNSKKELTPEMLLFTQLQKAGAQAQMYHYHVTKKFNTQVKYADPYAHSFIKYATSLARNTNRPWKTLDHKLQRKQIKYKLSCLNNATRDHRSLITTLCLHFEDCYFTHRGAIIFNESLEFSNRRITEIYHRNRQLKKIQTYTKNKMWQTNQLNPERFNDSLHQIQKSFCHIVTEDPYFDTGARISDKTLKSLFMTRPFLLLGTQGTLRWMRKQGFQTFSKWWDESYDQEPDHVKRLEAVYQIAEHIESLSFADCDEILKQMTPTLRNNRRVSLTSFKKITHRNLL